MDRTKATHRTVVTEIIGNGRYLVVPRWVYLMDRFRYGLSFMPLDCILHHQQPVAMDDRRPIAYSYHREVLYLLYLLPTPIRRFCLLWQKRQMANKSKHKNMSERRRRPYDLSVALGKKRLVARKRDLSASIRRARHKKHRHHDRRRHPRHIL